MIFKRELSILFLLLMLGGCVSQEEDCIQEIEDRGDGDICLYWFGNTLFLDSTDPVERAAAQRDDPILGALCLKYIMDIQACTEKSKTIPAVNL